MNACVSLCVYLKLWLGLCMCVYVNVCVCECICVLVCVPAQEKEYAMFLIAVTTDLCEPLMWMLETKLSISIK